MVPRVMNEIATVELKRGMIGRPWRAAAGAGEPSRADSYAEWVTWSRARWRKELGQEPDRSEDYSAWLQYQKQKWAASAAAATAAAKVRRCRLTPG